MPTTEVVLGDGASGDPDRPELTHDEWDADQPKAKTPAATAAPAVVRLDATPAGSDA